MTTVATTLALIAGVTASGCYFATATTARRALAAFVVLVGFGVALTKVWLP